MCTVTFQTVLAEKKAIENAKSLSLLYSEIFQQNAATLLFFFLILDLYLSLEEVEGELQGNEHLNYFTLTYVNTFLGKLLIIP